MQVNQTTLTAYNKFNKGSQGTLIGNWQEEREIRDITGNGRTIPGTHIKKDRTTLFQQSGTEISNTSKRPIDDTNERTQGKKVLQWPTSEGHVYGTGENKAEEIRKVGSKSVKREEFFLQQIGQELKEIQQQDVDDANSRQFETTHKEQFIKKDPISAGNVVGKRVMKSQNGEPIPYNQKDGDFLVDQGLSERQQFLTDEQLRKYLPRGESYLTQQPITFWQEKQNDGCFYQSKPHKHEEKLTFHQNNDFLKTYQHYTHIKK